MAHTFNTQHDEDRSARRVAGTEKRKPIDAQKTIRAVTELPTEIERSIKPIAPVDRSASSSPDPASSTSKGGCRRNNSKNLRNTTGTYAASNKSRHGAQVPFSVVKDKTRPKQSTKKKTGYRTCGTMKLYSPNMPHDDSDANPPIVIECDPDNVEELTKLLEWLKMRATLRQKSLPVNPDPLVCMPAHISRVDRRPQTRNRQPQDQGYRQAQTNQRSVPRRSEQERRASAVPTNAASTQRGEDEFIEQIRAREQASLRREQTCGTNMSDVRPNRNEGKHKTPNKRPAKKPQIPSPKKALSRAGSFKSDTTAAVSQPSQPDANSTSNDLSPNLACNTPLPDSATTAQLPDWVRDVNAPLPEPSSPTVCMLANSRPKVDRSVHDSRYRRVEQYDRPVNPQNDSPERKSAMVKREQKRNAAMKKQIATDRKKAYNALRKQKSLETEALYGNDRSGVQGCEDGEVADEGC